MPRREKLSGRYMKNTAILLVDCPDRKGIVASIADFLYKHNANVLHADQHQDADLGSQPPPDCGRLKELLADAESFLTTTKLFLGKQ